MHFLKNKFILFLLLFINIIFFICSFNRFGMFFIDTSREVYVPMAMNEGAILYKDIFNVYSPLGYQINALLINLFGDNLNTFYTIGLINSLLFIIGFYLISNLFFKNNKLLSLLISLLISTSCIYAVSLVNYIFPYSYSVVFSLTTFTYTLYFLLKYAQNSNKKNILLSSFFFGICLALKYEFFLFGIVLLSIFLYKKENLKTQLLSLLLFISVPLLSILFVLIQGCEISDLITATKEIGLLTMAQSVKKCYEFLGLIPTITSIKNIICYASITIPVLVITFSFFFKLQKIKNNNIKIPLILSSTLLIIYLLKNVFFESNSHYFNWIGISTIIICLLHSIFLFKKKSCKINDKLFFILSLSIILASAKCICSVNFNNYGTYYFPFLFLCTTIYCYNYLPHTLKIKTKTNLKIYRNTFSIIIAILFLLYTLSNVDRRNYSFSKPINTHKGCIFVDDTKDIAINSTIKYINENTTKNDTILVLPEGAMINYLTNRKSHNRFYYLIPPNIEIFGEGNIIYELEKDLPDYLVIQPMSFNNFHETYFCESFGTQICNLIPKYYEKPIVFGDNFWLAIYKKKESNEK